MSDKWLCRLINHDGDGPPGKEQVINYVTPVHSSRDAAEAFTCELVDAECREEGMDQHQFDGAVYTVESKAFGATAWDRYRVRVSVRLEYEGVKQ